MSYYGWIQICTHPYTRSRGTSRDQQIAKPSWYLEVLKTLNPISLVCIHYPVGVDMVEWQYSEAHSTVAISRAEFIGDRRYTISGAVMYFSKSKLM